MSTLLPIDELLPDIIGELRSNSNLVLRAPPGAGKTTRLPAEILEANLIGDQMLVVVEPRRLAAMSGARRVAQERNSQLGDRVGYQVRFDRRANNSTRLMFVTEGILLRWLQDDPFLTRVGGVVFDEFHERNLASDLTLAMLRQVQRELRPELKLVAMSATIETEGLAQFLDCRSLESQGRQHPVDIRYSGHSTKGELNQAMAAAVGQLLSGTTGHLLLFLPGVGEIRRVRSVLDPLCRDQAEVLELYGDLPLDQQDRVLTFSARRKVVLATNVAETSITIDGVTGVVDAGLARILRFDAGIGLDRLQVERISRSSADQRAGRAGRTGPGVCLRLWSEAEQRAMRETELPEIRRIDLADAVLQLHCWGQTSVSSFPWFEAPLAESADRAVHLLEMLGALRSGSITSLGREMARIPVAPRLARLLMEGGKRRCLTDVALIAAMLSERDPFYGAGQGRGGGSVQVTDSDVLDRAHALRRLEQEGHRESQFGAIDLGKARSIFRLRDLLLRTVNSDGVLRSATGATDFPPDESILRSLLVAFPDRVARRREPHSRRGVLVGGRGVELSNSSQVREGELFLCVDVQEQGRGEALVRQASFIDPAWLPDDLLTKTIDVEFDETRDRVVTFDRLRYRDLVIHESPGGTADAGIVAEVLARHAVSRLDVALNLNDEPIALFLARVAFLREWMPELGLPKLDRATIAELLPSMCGGCRSFADLKRVPVLDWLRGQLSPKQLALLDREAPERIATPKGNRIRLRYDAGNPPVMAVRIQEIFGMQDTPRIAGGRVPIVMHLLGPNMRPQQITNDLQSFWRNGYPIIRKELRARYPKHAWPEIGPDAARNLGQGPN